MPVQPLFSTNNDANSEAWFMNKISESGVTKIPTSRMGTKQRSMEDIQGFSSINCKSQKWARRCGTTDDRKNGLKGLGYNLSARTETGISTKSWAQLFGDSDNEEMEKMTLQDMQRMLRKAIQRPLNMVDSGEPAAGHFSQSSSDSGTLPSVDSEAPSVGLELLLEDSTSNSSDSMSLKGDLAGISSSSGISRGLLNGNSADLFSGHKRFSMVSESRAGTEVAADDEWTLRKWQKLHHKQHIGRKRLREPYKVQQEISESISKVCLDSPSLALLDARAGISEVESSQDASFLSECNGIKDNCKTDSSDCKPHERLASVKDPLLTPEIFAHEDSSQMLASFCSHSTVRQELEDESEIATSNAFLPGRLQNTSRNGWALKACGKIETTPLPKFALPQAMLVCKTKSGIPFRKAGELSNFNSDRASVKVSWQRNQSEDNASSLSPGYASGSKQQRTAAPVHDTDKPKAVLSKEFRHLKTNQVRSSLNEKSSNSLAEQLEGTLPLERSKGIGCLGQWDSIISQRSSKGLPVFSASLNCIETLEIEEEQEPREKPAKIPCKRKAISPMSQEFLLKASKLGEFGVDAEKRGMKKPPLVFDEGWVDVPKWTFGANERNGQKQEAPKGSPCHVKAQAQVLDVGPTTTTSQHISACAQKISPVNSPSKPHNLSKVTTTISPAGLSPLVPAKGILRSSCRGPCGCEECASVRSRADRASEFSQRQMQDIEGLAVKLMKDLSILRNIVEDRLIQSSAKHRSPQPVLNIDQLKKATANASETEETAKKWLVRMARDCNRYCKIMRMQGRKLTFADESGGKLCHVKVFHSEPHSDCTTGLHRSPLEANCSTSSTPNEPAVEEVCAVEGTFDEND